ncbi:MAG: DUF2079 domain-containing protein, partial [Fervidicoccaceae archaeon]
MKDYLSIIKLIKNLKNIIKKIFNDKYLIILFIVFTFLTSYFIYFSLIRFFSLNATVYDLGVAMQHAQDFLNYHFTSFSLIWNPIIWIIFPIFIPANYPLILTFQAIWISIAVFPIYGIGKMLLNNKMASLFISISYLFNFLIVGFYEYDFHYQVLFPTFFILGYFFYLKNYYKISFVLIILSGLTRYPYMLFGVLFGFVLLIDYLIKYKKPVSIFFKKREFIYSFSIFLFSLIILIYQFLLLDYISMGNAISTTNVFMGLSYKNSIFYSIDVKIFTFTLVFGPLLLLSLFSKKFFIFYMPFLVLLFLSNKWQFVFPSLIGLQYTALIIPFIYLGAIDSLKNIFLNSKYKNNKSTSEIDKIFYKNSKSLIRISIAIFIFILLLSLIYQPFGIIKDNGNEIKININNGMYINSTIYNNLNKVISLIPKNDPYVLVQYNLPQYYPASLPYGFCFFNVAGFLYNLTLEKHYYWAEAFHQDYLIFNLKKYPSIINARIDYILADMYAFYSYTWPNYPSLPNSPSMYDFTHLFYGSGEYGIVAEASGIVLLEKNYTGPLKYYVPFYGYYPANEFSNAQFSKLINNEMVVTNVTEESLTWHGPFT